MPVREFSDFARSLFDDTSTYVAEKASNTVQTIKRRVTANRKVPWMVTAAANLGTVEGVGYRNNPRIVSWAERIGGAMKRIYTQDSTPWCGLFVAHCMHANEIPITISNPLGARNWLKFGVPVDPCFGAVMVFWRGSKNGWQGHVAFYVGEDSNYYHVIGGNQGNKVSVARYPKSRFLGARWPKGYRTLYQNNSSRIHRKFSATVGNGY